MSNVTRSGISVSKKAFTGCIIANNRCSHQISDLLITRSEAYQTKREYHEFF